MTEDSTVKAESIGGTGQEIPKETVQVQEKAWDKIERKEPIYRVETYVRHGPNKAQIQALVDVDNPANVVYAASLTEMLNGRPVGVRPFFIPAASIQEAFSKVLDTAKSEKTRAEISDAKPRIVLPH